MNYPTPFEVKDFSGGRTDNYVDGPANKYRTADNLLIVKHDSTTGKLLTRFGSELYDSAHPLVNAAIERLGAIRNFRTTSGDKVLVFSNKKLFQPIVGVWTAVTGPTGNQLYPSGTTTANINSYAEWNDHIFTTNDAFARASKLYNDGSNVLQLRTAGLPKLASSPTVTPTANTGKSFVYRFVHKYTYVVGTVTFIDRSSYVEVSVTNADAPNVNQNNITAIPTLANALITNWDTSNIKIEIYRTVNAGTVFFRIGEVTNGTAVFTDNFSDTTIQANELLYTEGGVVQNDAVPLAKLVHITGDVCYWAHTKEGSEIHSNRLYQAVAGDPDSVPATFFTDVQDEIVGLSSTRGLPILLCKNSVYRVDGQFDLQGRGGMSAQKISDTATCASSQSVVQTIEGVFWAGEDSYYFTDGYQVIKLVEDWATSYKVALATATQKGRIQGKYDKRNRRIWWTTQQGSSGGDDCSSCDVLHLDWGIRRDSVFTSISGGTQFAPTAIEFIDEDMLRGDRNGYLLIHSEDLVSDPKIDVAVTPSSWQTKTIIWTYESCAFNFGTTFLRKYATDILVTCKNASNLSLQIISINDDGRKIRNLKPIRFRGNITWGDPTIIWGDPSIIWGFDGIIEDQRRFPAKSLRCSYKAIKLTNAFVNVINSDILGTATVNNSAKTAHLDSAANADWPVDAVDYYISFETDDYTTEYLITARAADTITYSDVANASSSGAGVEWVIRGYPKGEILNLISYTIGYRLMGQTQQFFTPSESGDVGT